jgi:hypothetical protein
VSHLQHSSNRPPLTTIRILRWCDAFRKRHGRWPGRDDQSENFMDCSWSALDQCLKVGLRGLPGNSSLRKLLHERRGVRHKGRLPPLTIPQILTWADAHHQRTGFWPLQTSGRVLEDPAESWSGINASLTIGGRGLKPGSSLAKLLDRERNVISRVSRARLSIHKILLWADSHYQRTGSWPNRNAGEISGTAGDTWKSVDAALKRGSRGLKGGSTLAQLLERHRGIRHLGNLPALTEEGILAWADAYHAEHGDWPTADAGQIDESPQETWQGIDGALQRGSRGLDQLRGSSLTRFLAQYRGKRNQANLLSLTESLILSWADAHHRRVGRWPIRSTGVIIDAPGETWSAVNSALKMGRRGLPGGSSLAQLLELNRGVRNRANLPTLTIEQILVWADAHYQTTGRWPKGLSTDPIPNAPGETWSGIHAALAQGQRGFSGGSSLARVLSEHRGVRNPQALPPLTHKQILGWARTYFERQGRWPVVKAGMIPESEGENWAAVNAALELGLRGLPGGESLARLIAKKGKHRKG